MGYPEEFILEIVIECTEIEHIESTLRSGDRHRIDATLTLAVNLVSFDDRRMADIVYLEGPDGLFKALARWGYRQELRRQALEFFTTGKIAPRKRRL